MTRFWRAVSTTSLVMVVRLLISRIRVICAKRHCVSRKLPLDAWLNGFVVDQDNSPPVSDSSFHPNAAGQHTYAEILDQYIRDSIAAGAGLNDAGLPVNAAPRRFTGHVARGDTGARPSPQLRTGTGAARHPCRALTRPGRQPTAGAGLRRTRGPRDA